MVLGCLDTAVLSVLGFRNYMNDSLRTDVFVRFQPESIACACIYLAARTLEVSVPLPQPSPAQRSALAYSLRCLTEKQAASQSPEPWSLVFKEYVTWCCCVHRSLCLIVPIGFFCLEQLKKKFKKFV